MNNEPVSLDLGVVGNCPYGATQIDRRARIVWCRMQRFDGDPVVHSLPDSKDGAGSDGTFSIELEGMTHSEEAYDGGTAVLRTRLFDADGGHPRIRIVVRMRHVRAACWRRIARRPPAPCGVTSRRPTPRSASSTVPRDSRVPVTMRSGEA